MYPPHFGSNPLFPKRKDFVIRMKDPQTGLGVMTRRGFKKGELVAMLTGEIIHDIRQHSLQIDDVHHLYDIHFSGFFLHSCEPNITVDMKRLTVHALRDIRPNQYLYMDYAETEDRLFKQFPCNCGSKKCRGWITGRKEMIPDMDRPFMGNTRTRKAL